MTHIYRIFGPPGTGKTTYLLNMVEQELASGIQPEQIVYTSFTRAAAIEARDRAWTRFYQYDPDQFIWFSTIHSICFRKLGLKRENVFAGPIIRKFCYETGYEKGWDGTEKSPDIDDLEIQGQILQTTADYFEFFINWYRNMMLDFETALDIFDRINDIPKSAKFTRPFLVEYIQKRNQYKAENSLYDFTDMLEMVLNNQIYPSHDIKVVVADEYQDQTPLLAGVSTMWAQAPSVERYYVAGDPYQAIYQFAGANPEIFLSIKSDQDIVLKQSYRCSHSVHDLSRRVVSRFKTRYKDDDFDPTNQTGAISHVFQTQLDWEKIIKSGGNSFYLHRTNYLLSMAYIELVTLGVPFGSIRGMPSPLQSSKAKTIAALYRLANGERINISDVARIMDNLPTRTQTEQFLTYGAKTDLKKMEQSKPDMMFAPLDLVKVGFAPNFYRYLKPELVLAPLKLSDTEKRYFRLVAKNFGYDILTKDPPVMLGTIHSVKGRETDNVIINTNLTKKTSEAMLLDPDPEHRLYYVGITRARNNIIVIQPDSPMKSYLL